MGAGSDAELAGYQQYAPSPALRPFVQRFLHGYNDAADSHVLTIPPSGSMFLSYVDGAPLHVHFSDRSYREEPRLFIGGQLRREAPRLESQGRFSLIGTEFTPTGFHRLYGVDAAHYTDRITDFAVDWPDEAALLAEELAASQDVPARIAALDQYLCQRVDTARTATTVERALAHIQAEHGLVRIEQLAEHCATSARHLQRRFLRAVGVTPKHFAKLVQLNAVIAGLVGTDPGNLHVFAVECGYYDQSHFIRDFQRLVGTQPMNFLRQDDDFLRTYLAQRTQPS